MAGNDHERWKPADRVVAQEDGGEGFLLHLDTGRYYSLNRTGMVVWRAIEAGTDPVGALQGRYPSSAPDDLARDVEAVLAELTSAHLVADRAGDAGPALG